MSTKPAPPNGENKSLLCLVLRSWLNGQSRPDVEKVLMDHPEWRDDKAVLLDLVYAEYCLREKAGEQVNPDDYFQRFPSLRASFDRLLRNHRPEMMTAMPAALPPEPMKTIEVNPHLVEWVGPQKQWPEAGETFCDHELLRQMGRGAFARVFLARENATGRIVVIKVADRGGHEAMLLGRFQHRNVVPILTARNDPATGFSLVSMPFVGSSTLEDLQEMAYGPDGRRSTRRANIIIRAANRHQRPENPVVEDIHIDPFLNKASFEDGIVWLGVRLAEGLAYVHSKGALHRDLKPSNVLIGLDGQPRLIDFNLSSDVESGRTSLGGTLPYMPPEQLRPFLESDQIGTSATDPRSDLYGLGIMLYELLSGTHPVGHLPRGLGLRDLASYLLERQAVGFKPLHGVVPGVNRRLSVLVSKVLSSRIEDRPASAIAFLAELRRCYSTRQRIAAASRKRAGALVAIGCLTFVAAGGLTLSGAFGASAHRDTVAHRPSVEALLSAGRTGFEAGSYEAAIASLSLAIESEPRNADLYFWRGKARLAGKDLMLARSDFESANQFRPKHGPTLAFLAYVRAKTGLVHEAIHASEGAAQAGMNPVVTRILRANVAVERTAYTVAKTELDALVKAYPQSRLAYANRALLALHEADQKRVVPGPEVYSDLEKALSLGSPDAKLYVLAANAYALKANRDQEANPLAKQRCLEFLAAACQAGETRESLMKSRVFQTVLGGADTQWAKLPVTTPGKVPPPMLDGLFIEFPS